MTKEHQLDLIALEKKITDVNEALASLANKNDLKELILLTKRPGWTTPAEYIFFSSILESMTSHAKALATLKDNLLKGSKMVEFH